MAKRAAECVDLTHSDSEKSNDSSDLSFDSGRESNDSTDIDDLHVSENEEDKRSKEKEKLYFESGREKRVLTSPKKSRIALQINRLREERYFKYEDQPAPSDAYIEAELIKVCFIYNLFIVLLFILFTTASWCHCVSLQPLPTPPTQQR